MKLIAKLFQLVSVYLWLCFAVAVAGVFVDLLAGVDATPKAIIGLAVWAVVFALAGAIVKKEAQFDLTKSDDR